MAHPLVGHCKKRFSSAFPATLTCGTNAYKSHLSCKDVKLNNIPLQKN